MRCAMGWLHQVFLAKWVDFMEIGIRAKIPAQGFPFHITTSSDLEGLI